ncbi:ATP-binding cassette domain-containing protein [Aeromicrobium sp. P5_D10]
MASQGGYVESAAPGLLSVRDLRVTSAESGRELVKGISFDVRRGETVALVGESGSGKSLTGKALVGLLPKGLAASGAAMLASDDLIAASTQRMRSLRGNDIGMLLQDPFTMLNPLIRIKTLLAETLLATPEGASRRSRSELTVEIDRRLAEVGITATGVAQRYPWELSGGMRQRAGMAASLAKDPDLLIADEPTTALDATTQREVLLLLRRIQQARGMGLLLITHDLRVAFSMSDRVLVMSQGEILEEADPDRLRAHPVTAYTKRLLAADLPLDRRLASLTGAPSPEGAEPVSGDGSARSLLRVRDVRKQFGTKRTVAGTIDSWALKGVDVDLRDGTNVGIIGESGSGKTTLARCLLGLETATSGSIEIDGLQVGGPAQLTRIEKRRVQGLVQCVFQDPYSSLNPSHRIGFILAEAVRLRDGGSKRDDEAVRAEVAQLLAEVHLPGDFAARRPGTLSGGQRQRVAIARALAMRPKILVCDEPVAALDLSVQSQVLQVLRDVQAKGVNLLFITHDLAVVRQMTEEVVVLFHGEIVERGKTSDVIDNPQHSYTKRLLTAVPTGTSEWLDKDLEGNH